MTTTTDGMTQPVLLMLADISGYTQFMVQHDTAFAAQPDHRQGAARSPDRADRRAAADLGGRGRCAVSGCDQERGQRDLAPAGRQSGRPAASVVSHVSRSGWWRSASTRCAAAVRVASSAI